MITSLTVNGVVSQITVDGAITDVSVVYPGIITSIGQVGPQGPRGYAGGTISLAAEGAVGGHRVIVSNGDGTGTYADSSNAAHAGKIVGITLSAVSDGEQMEIYTSGEVIEPSWAWAPGPIYVGSNGLMTQAPTGAFIQMIAVALSPNIIVININQPIVVQ